MTAVKKQHTEWYAKHCFRIIARSLEKDSMRCTLVLLLISSPLFFPSDRIAFAQRTMDLVYRKYEGDIQAVATLYMRKEYAGALDQLKRSRVSLAGCMPVPLDTFSWAAFRALNTYTLLFSRLIESALLIQAGNDSLAFSQKKQIQEWSSVLLEQGRVWYAMPITDMALISFRKRWLNRFRVILNHTRNLAPDE